MQTRAFAPSVDLALSDDWSPNATVHERVPSTNSVSVPLTRGQELVEEAFGRGEKFSHDQDADGRRRDHRGTKTLRTCLARTSRRWRVTLVVVRNPLTANVLQVLSRHAPAADEMLERVCKAQGWRASDLTSSQLEQIIPALCEMLAAAGDDGDDCTGDLRLLLDTDRFRRERIATKASRPVVLVVEDDEDTREAFAQVLEEGGYDVAQASNGADAWAQLEGGARPAAILLDLMMPLMSGWQLWDHMQAVPALVTTPLVVVTASGLGPGSFGQTIVLRKPVSRTQLLGAVSVSVLR
jgi:CheY-like chemotaxis protein